MTTFTAKELQRATAHHEAGHAVVTLASRYFQLPDPALKLEPEPGKTAQSGTRPRVPGMPVTKEAALEHIAVALAGREAEKIFADITQAEGRRISLHADSAEFDLNWAAAGLRHWQAEHLRADLERQARECIEANIDAWKEIAQLVMDSFGVKPELGKAEVEALPAVQKMLLNKPPL
ncbi:MAG: hypothetical protein JSR75_19800 [Proteobacteria bacterium]|nr:hypothetical protein [Pseudomonadota bacterium]